MFTCAVRWERLKITDIRPTCWLVAVVFCHLWVRHSVSVSKNPLASQVNAASVGRQPGLIAFNSSNTGVGCAREEGPCLASRTQAVRCEQPRDPQRCCSGCAVKFQPWTSADSHVWGVRLSFAALPSLWGLSSHFFPPGSVSFISSTRKFEGGLSPTCEMGSCLAFCVKYNVYLLLIRIINGILVIS